MEINNFIHQLNRLKHELHVSKDLEVAQFLGMTKSAMAERKKRGAFPTRHLRAAAQQSDRAIDVDYVLFGERQGNTCHAATKLVAHPPPSDEMASELLDFVTQRAQHLGISDDVAADALLLALVRLVGPIRFASLLSNLTPKPQPILAATPEV